MEVKYIEELRLGLAAELEAMKSAEDREVMKKYDIRIVCN